MTIDAALREQVVQRLLAASDVKIAASEIHGGPDVFNRAGRFPSPESFDLPLSQQARSYYKSGLPFVYRYLPAWLAGVTERLLILLIPLLVVVIPAAIFVGLVR